MAVSRPRQTWPGQPFSEKWRRRWCFTTTNAKISRHFVFLRTFYHFFRESDENLNFEYF